MNYINISYPDLNNGIGCRVTLWLSGCSHKCKGCHNPESWDYYFGHIYNSETKKKILDICKLPYIKGLTLSGGEPLQFTNTKELADLCKEVHNLNKDVWCYTGYYYKELPKPLKEFVDNNVDVLVDGPFEIDKLDTTSNNPFKGSINQHIIYVNK